MPIRAAFDARVLERPELAERGIGRYAACLLDAYAEAGLPVTPLRNLRRPPAPARFAEAFEHLLLARDVKRAGTDVLHQPSIDYASLRPGAPLVVTVHDLVPLKRPERYLRTGLKHRLRYAAVRRAARVITPSRAVAADCERLLGVEATVVPEAAAPVFRPVADPRAALGRLNLPGRFVLWVGGLDPPDPRKGVAALVNAVARRDGPPLVLAGRVDAEAEHLAVPGRVLLAGRVTDDELAALYSAADALVFPSAEEGFGLPPVEALACGTPVAAFASAALGETLAGAQGAVLVEPGDLDALLDAAASLTGTRAAAPQRSWADVARETWAVLEQAAQSPQLR
jgi:glycosyltransferase involved in cell wall biosynthesis